MLQGRVKAPPRTARTGRSATAVALAVTAVLGAVAGCDDGPGAAPEITTTARAGVAPVPPKEGAYFGAWVPPGGATPEPTASGDPDDTDTTRPTPQSGLGPVRQFETAIGRKLDIAQTYVDWNAAFPARGTADLLREGDRYLLLTWGGTDTQDIAAGRHDKLIRERARAIRASGKPIFLRWQPGMDRDALRESRIHGSRDFIKAWKHIRSLFKKERVQNVAWVWCPTAGGFAADASGFYPGDDQVDWICVDARPTGEYDYRDLSEIMRPFLDWAGDRPKPIMVAELGVPHSYGARRADWLRGAAKTLQNPQVKAVVYFNSDERARAPRDRRRRYSVTGDDKAVSALRELATTPYFNPRSVPVTSGG